MNAFYKLTFLVALFLAVLFLDGCAVRGNEQIHSAVDWEKDHIKLAVKPRYRTIAVMPFKNSSAYERAAFYARQSFFGNLAATKDYKLQPMPKTNLLIDELPRKSKMSANAKELGEILKVDLIAFGDVINVSHSYGVVFAKNSAHVHVYLVDAKTGQTIWESNDTRSSSLFGISLISMGNYEVMWAREICNRYDELFRDMMVVLPNCSIKQ